MDLSNLPPAPWEVTPFQRFIAGDVTYRVGGEILQSKYFAEFAALAWNAFDVMRRHDPAAAMLWLTDTERWCRENLAERRQDGDRPLRQTPGRP